MPEQTFKLSSHDGSFFKSGDSAGLYFERILEHPVHAVWAALTEPEHLAKWLAPAVIEAGKGGSISLKLSGGVMGGKITEWRKPDGRPRQRGGDGPADRGTVGSMGPLVEYAWHNGSTVRWELLTEGEGRTRLVFTHRHVTASQLIDAAKGWHYHLDMLTLVLDGKPKPHNPVEQWDEISREATIRYTAAAKLLAPDPEPFVIERVFDAPVERVWQALTNKEEIKHWSFDIPEFEPTQGYEFTFNGEHEDRIFIHYCHITEVIEHRKLTYSWRYRDVKGITMVTWELFPEGKKTRLRLTHTGLEKMAYAGPDYQRQNFEMGWTAIFGELSNWLQKTPAVVTP